MIPDFEGAPKPHTLLEIDAPLMPERNEKLELEMSTSLLPIKEE